MACLANRIIQHPLPIRSLCKQEIGENDENKQVNYFFHTSSVRGLLPTKVFPVLLKQVNQSCFNVNEG